LQWDEYCSDDETDLPKSNPLSPQAHPIDQLKVNSNEASKQTALTSSSLNYSYRTCCGMKAECHVLPSQQNEPPVSCCHALCTRHNEALSSQISAIQENLTQLDAKLDRWMDQWTRCNEWMMSKSCLLDPPSLSGSGFPGVKRNEKKRYLFVPTASSPSRNTSPIEKRESESPSPTLSSISWSDSTISNLSIPEFSISSCPNVTSSPPPIEQPKPPQRSSKKTSRRRPRKVKK
jgi:hypothetical protein